MLKNNTLCYENNNYCYKHLTRKRTSLQQIFQKSKKIHVERQLKYCDGSVTPAVLVTSMLENYSKFKKFGRDLKKKGFKLNQNEHQLLELDELEN